MTNLPAIGPVHTGCLSCPPKPAVAPLAWQPHPGFGVLTLTCDSEVPEFWLEWLDWPVEPVLWGSWESGTVRAGPRKGESWHKWIGGEQWPRLDEEVTLGEIEEAVATDPDHDWRLEIHGPMGGAVYQRQGCARWVAIERLDGFA